MYNRNDNDCVKYCIFYFKLNMTNDIEVITIYGKAGCGKSTLLSSLICKDTDNYVVLSSTNAAVNNIYRLCKHIDDNIDRNNFKTIYSFFRIDYKNDVVLGAIDMVNTVYIDEFSLIDKHIFKKCLHDMRQKGCRKLILCGDALQLNAVYKTKQRISFNSIDKWNIKYNNILNKSNHEHLLKFDNVQYLPTSVIEHLHLSIFGLKFVQSGKLVNLHINKRSNDEIKNILHHIYNIPINNSNNNILLDKFIMLNDISKYVVNDGYVFISSKYSILQKIYDYIYDNFWSNPRKYNADNMITIKQNISFSTGYKRLYLYPGMKIIVCDTDVNKKYINGEELIFTGNFENNKMKCLNENNEYVYIPKLKEIDKLNTGEYYPISPSFLLTIHKSQGRSIDNIIVCIDDLFDVSMMYTAITRAKNNLLFYSKETDDNKRITTLIKNAYINEFKQLNILCDHLSHRK